MVLGGTLFRVDLEKKIGIADRDASTPTGYDYQWKNEGDAYTQGVELTSDISLIEDVNLASYITCTDAQYKNAREDFVGGQYEDRSKYISRIPEFAAGLGISWSPDTWTLSLNGDWTGGMYLDHEGTSEIVETGSFWIWNTQLSKKISQHGLKLFVGAKNLFDEVQKDRRTDDAAFMYKPLTGRTVYGGFTVEF